MFDSLFLEEAASDISFSNFMIALIVSLVLGFLSSFIYTRTNKSKLVTNSFSLTLVMLPAVITVIIVMVGTNVASAFSLAGAFSIIRFRSESSDPKDLTYILLSMAIGLACGMGFIIYAIIVAFLLCLIIGGFEKFGLFGLSQNKKVLKITIPENLDYENAFRDIMEKSTNGYYLTTVRTTELGSLYELIYEIILKERIKEKDFLDEIRCRNGNLSISMLNIQK